MGPPGAHLPHAHKPRCLPRQKPVPFPSSFPGVGLGWAGPCRTACCLAGTARGRCSDSPEKDNPRGVARRSARTPRTALQPTITTQRCACASVPADPKGCDRASSHGRSQLEPCSSTTCHRQQPRGYACPCSAEAARNAPSSTTTRNVKTSFPLARTCWGHP